LEKAILALGVGQGAKADILNLPREGVQPFDQD
jgi:hypothetical protein